MTAQPFAWLSLSQQQDPDGEDQSSQLPAPPMIPVAPAPSTTRRQWTNVERIMLASLVLNAVWFTVYAIRSGAVHLGGD